MNVDRKNIRGTLLIITGLLLIAAALVLVFYNKWDSDRAGRASSEVIQELEAAISEGNASFSYYEGMPAVEIGGNMYIGIIEIPSLDIKLPVMAEWNYDNLKISPCRYSGSYYTDDMVVCAHNYASHFGPVKGIDIGADIYFTAVGGRVYHYRAGNIEKVKPADVEAMTDDRTDSWDMTLFTCNQSGKTRCAVRCIRQE